ncbi:MAG: chlorite dismutase family protein [bacterium]|nr:chlorite dismutase family protein [bacterium]MXZ78842.1 chlorite dismutase [Acidimicrobiia bacterium]MYE73509.1 chlorite dismutase [Acidimicrobiia bacterium]MYJ63790.1 chlorite dismutase [Acidimicrobiia bacterium]
MSDSPAPVQPSVGIGVLHLFGKLSPGDDRSQLERGIKRAVKDAEQMGVQVVTVAVLGHKADMAFMALHTDLWELRDFQRDLQQAGLDIVDSYVSLTELSEYAAGLPEETKQARLYPQLPPEGKPAWCFYPMSKRRNPDQNWYELPFERRQELMYAHGATGRTFAGRVLQLITGSTGIDDYEWGVTLFCQHPDDLKEVVYTMRYDQASARYAEFGPFYVGMVAPVDTLLSQLL